MMIEDASKTRERLQRADSDPVQAGEWWQRTARTQSHCNKRASAINLSCSSTGPTLVIGERRRERLSFAACGTCQWIDAALTAALGADYPNPGGPDELYHPN